jgi:hypothetical protein
MNRVRSSVRLALTAVALLGLALPVGAQGVPKDRVPFKATMKASSQLSFVPGNPARVSVQESGTGEATPLGAFTWVAHVVDDTDPEEQGLGIAEGVGTIAAANGDAVYVKFGFIRRPPLEPNLLRWESVWLVTGGKGRFAGATGSGVSRIEVIPPTATNPAATTSVTWDGTISAPKP